MKTKDGKDIKIGDKLKDNDPRQGDRTLTVIKAGEEGYVIARSRLGADLKVRCDRVHGDGKARRSGFTLVPKVEV